MNNYFKLHPIPAPEKIIVNEEFNKKFDSLQTILKRMDQLNLTPEELVAEKWALVYHSVFAGKVYDCEDKQKLNPKQDTLKNTIHRYDCLDLEKKNKHKWSVLFIDNYAVLHVFSIKEAIRMYKLSVL